MLKIFIITCSVTLLFIIYVRFLEHITVFLPSKTLQNSPADIGLSYENVYFLSGQKYRLHGWFLPASVRPREVPTLIYLHGNAGNIGGRLDKLLLFHQMGINVFIFDYRGYGTSEGSPTEKGMYADSQAAYDCLLSRNDLNEERFIAYGESLGGAAAVDLALARPTCALILDSTFTSAAAMAKQIVPYVPSVLLSVKLDSLSKIQNVSIPKLIIHSLLDETVPYRFGRELFEKAAGPKEFLEITGNHNEGFLVSERSFSGGIKAFLRQYGLQKVF